ncbi:MAG: DegT/DnrJ/EryC1/StrS family aminotransferase [Polyangiaceae bacterium]
MNLGQILMHNRLSFDKRLALLGGEPVRRKSWPTWPQADLRTKRYVQDVLRSGRWGIGGKYMGAPLYERRFAEAFARFHGVAHCVPVANGSAALVTALAAIGVGFGDEVIIPGLVWISCATAVRRVGAIPVLVDVDAQTLCITPEAVHRAMTPKTKAVIVVHAYCAVADMDAFAALAVETGIPIIEDCSQAHGSTWKGRRVGTFGRVGIFSMGNSKLLSCGEGGAAITNDFELYDKMQQVRGDGYRYKSAAPCVGHSELEEHGSIQGYNFCLSEFQSAVLFGGLRNLERQNQLRQRNGAVLRDLCSSISGITVLHRHPNVDTLAYFRFCTRLDLSVFGGASIEQIRRAAVAELNESTIERVDPPLNNYHLYKPLASVGGFSDSQIIRVDPTGYELPVAEQAYGECLTFHHAMLLGTESDMFDIARMFEKLKANRESLAGI